MTSGLPDFPFSAKQTRCVTDNGEQRSHRSHLFINSTRGSPRLAGGAALLRSRLELVDVHLLTTRPRRSLMICVLHSRMFWLTRIEFWGSQFCTRIGWSEGVVLCSGRVWMLAETLHSEHKLHAAFPSHSQAPELHTSYLFSSIWSTCLLEKPSQSIKLPMSLFSKCWLFYYWFPNPQNDS